MLGNSSKMQHHGPHYRRACPKMPPSLSLAAAWCEHSAITIIMKARIEWTEGDPAWSSQRSHSIQRVVVRCLAKICLNKPSIASQHSCITIETHIYPQHDLCCSQCCNLCRFFFCWWWKWISGFDFLPSLFLLHSFRTANNNRRPDTNQECFSKNSPNFILEGVSWNNLNYWLYNFLVKINLSKLCVCIPSLFAVFFSRSVSWLLNIENCPVFKRT